MAFTVGDFHDLVRLLDQHPEWRAELRRLVLTDELLGLPAAVRELAEGIGRLDERVGQLEAALTALAEAQARTEATLSLLAGRMGRAEVHIGDMRGDILERRYRERAAAYFRRVVRRPAAISAQQLVDLLDSPEAAGRLSEEERDDVLLADLVVRGRPESGEGDVYVVVEVSTTIDAHDVARAFRRATLLGRLRTTLAMVAGESITPDAEILASQRGVWRMLDGREQMPEVRAE